MDESAKVKTNLRTLCIIVGAAISITASICAYGYHLFAVMDSVRLDALGAADKLAVTTSNQWRQLREEVTSQSGRSWSIKDQAEFLHQARALGTKLPEMSEILRVTRTSEKDQTP